MEKTHGGWYTTEAMNRRAFLLHAASWLCIVGVWVETPIAVLAGSPDAELPEKDLRPRFRPPEYSYPFGPDPPYPDRKKALARRKIHDVVSKTVDQLLEAEQKDMTPDQVRQIKEKFAKDYEQILQLEFMLFDDP